MKTLTIPRFLAVGSQDKIRNKAEATSTAAGLEVIIKYDCKMYDDEMVLAEAVKTVTNIRFNEIEVTKEIEEAHAEYKKAILEYKKEKTK